MTPQDWAGFILTVLSIGGVIFGVINFLIKHYLSELKPNSGSSLKDQVSRLENAVEEQRIESERSRLRHEDKIDKMYDILLKHIDANNK
jgi:hypothetical protein